MELGGCAHDTSPAPPWGRAPVAPGGPCTVTLRWDAAGLTYPVLVDPLWSTADSLGTPRGHHQATLLANGRVLVTGGSSANFTDNAAYATAEIYDPVIDSWAATGSMAAARLEHVAALLPDGRVLVAGGRSDWLGVGLASAETFDPVDGTFTPTGSMGPGRAAARASALPSGKVLVTGGIDAAGSALASAQTYDGAADAWAPAGSFVGARAHHTATTLVDGRVLVLGGHQSQTSSSDDYPTSASVYDEGVGGWQPVADWQNARGWHTATRLQDGRVAVIGGFIVSTFLAFTDVYDPGTNTWSSAPDVPLGRDQHTATLLDNGNVLVTGGEVPGGMPGVSYPTNDAWLLTADASVWAATEPTVASRYAHTATLLDDGRVLLVGGFLVDFNNYPAQADVEIYGLLPNGSPCDTDGECNTASCRDGVCCDTACEGTCTSCIASLKGSGEDGVCGFIGAGDDPQDECLDGGAAACMQNGLCDGAGACQLYDGACVAKPCAGAAQCASGVCSVDGICCDDACNAVCESCLQAVNGSMDGKCLPVLLGTDPDHECPSMSDSDCSEISLCNGALACAPSAALCAPYVCRNDTACRIGCDDDTHCVSTHRCDDGVCVVREPGCEGSVAVTADGTEIECSPYLCQADGTCRTTCGSAADCVAGFACDGAGECVTVAAGGDTSDDGGCGCRLVGVGGGVGGGVGAPPARQAAWLLVAALPPEAS
ncbi:MAG: kelch repeat-containing protein [Polyangiaceae bacterium]